MNISFDPRNIVPLEGYGTVYPTETLNAKHLTDEDRKSKQNQREGI